MIPSVRSLAHCKWPNAAIQKWRHLLYKINLQRLLELLQEGCAQRRCLHLLAGRKANRLPPQAEHVGKLGRSFASATIAPDTFHGRNAGRGGRSPHFPPRNLRSKTYTARNYLNHFARLPAVAVPERRTTWPACPVPRFPRMRGWPDPSYLQS